MRVIKAVTFDVGDTITDLREGGPEYEARGRLRAGRVYDLLMAAGLAAGERDAFCARLAAAVEEYYAEAVARQAGLTLPAALGRFFREQGPAINAGLLAASAETWCAPANRPTPLRLGARDTLAALCAQGLRLGVISNTIQPGRYLDAVLARSGLAEFFSATVYSSEAGVAKPHPQIFRTALAALDVAPEQAVHVGDRLLNDVAGAQAVGMRGILIEVPQRVEFDPQIVADARIRELPELPALLASWAGSDGAEA